MQIFTIQRHKLHALVFVENGNKVMVKSSIYVDFAVKSVYFAIKIRNSHTFKCNKWEAYYCPKSSVCGFSMIRLTPLLCLKLTNRCREWLYKIQRFSFFLQMFHSSIPSTHVKDSFFLMISRLSISYSLTIKGMLCAIVLMMRYLAKSASREQKHHVDNVC